MKEHGRKGRHHSISKIRIGTIAVIAGCSFVMLFSGVYSGLRGGTDTGVFAPGTVVEDQDIGGLRYEEGKVAIQKAEEELLSGIQVTVTCNGAERRYTAKELGTKTNKDEVLAAAYERDKNGNIFADFDERKNPVRYKLELSIDEEALKETIGGFAQQQIIQPMDAKAEFNPYARTFEYTAEEAGQKADIQAAVLEVKEKIEKGTGGTIGVQVQESQPVVTLKELEENTELIGRCSTRAVSNANRDTNIRLMCEAVNGLVLEPGETLSINELVGERTAEKGFKPAPAITDGKNLTDELGGGICQLAGTLYNAALKADMEIVERVHHSWPSDYLPVGLDATLNWDNKDLKVKNRSEWPMYISARLEDHIVDVAIYGQPCEYEVEIESVILEEHPEPQPQVIYTDELAVGTQQTKVKGRKGYEAVVTRNYLLNGKVVSSEEISRDTFHEVQGVVLRGAEGKNK